MQYRQLPCVSPASLCARQSDHRQCLSSKPTTAEARRAGLEPARTSICYVRARVGPGPRTVLSLHPLTRHATDVLAWCSDTQAEEAPAGGRGSSLVMVSCPTAVGRLHGCPYRRLRCFTAQAGGLEGLRGAQALIQGTPSRQPRSAANRTVNAVPWPSLPVHGVARWL